MAPGELVDLDRHPLDRPGSPAHAALVAAARAALAAEGMFDLPGFLRPAAVAAALAEVAPVLANSAHVHARRHNIWFRKDMPDLPPGHPALAEFETVNRTVCAGQIAGGVLDAVYAWPLLAGFLAAVMGKPGLHTMADPLARINVMGYGPGEALSWHFDRSEFTTTLLLQAPEAGGEFEYRRALRSETDPNHDGIARLLAGQAPELRRVRLESGTLNVFRGRNTAHRVTPVAGRRERIIAVFSYFDRPGVRFSAEEQRGFYGRAT